MNAVVVAMPPTEAQTLHDFYSNILPSQGRYVLVTLPNAKQHFVKNVGEAVSKTLELEKASTGAVYHANAGYGATNTRTQSNVVSVKSFWVDIDCGDSKAAEGKGYATKRDATAAISHFLKNLYNTFPYVYCQQHM